MLPTFLYPLFMAITLGASIGILLLVFLLLTAVGLDPEITLIALGILGLVLLIVNSVFSAGYKGALLNEYYRALHKESVGISSFTKYAFANTLQFFTIALVKMVVIGFFLTPLGLIYYFLDLGSVHIALAYLFAGIGLFEWFVIEFFFAYSFIAYVEKKVKPFSAILISLNFIKDLNVKALLVYVFYCIVVLSTLIPLLNTIMYLVFYPIVATSLIKYFETQSAHY
ncbi:hypothetical protein JW721_03255 [Candidatus Micrarchaeota archaeon]|nr:hypothetical protein [Candidatus Micrarchaeota archaeon]